MARKHGKRGAILMSVNGTSEPVKVLSMAEFSFDDEPDRTDVTCYEDKNTQSVQGFPTGRGSFRGIWDTNESTLWKARASADGTILMWYPDYTIPDYYIKTPAWIACGARSTARGAVEVSGTWEANGDMIVALGPE
jgi:hypothetical protein